MLHNPVCWSPMLLESCPSVLVSANATEDHPDVSADSAPYQASGILSGICCLSVCLAHKPSAALAWEHLCDSWRHFISRPRPFTRSINDGRGKVFSLSYYKGSSFSRNSFIKLLQGKEGSKPVFLPWESRVFLFFVVSMVGATFSHVYCPHLFFWGAGFGVLSRS